MFAASRRTSGQVNVLPGVEAVERDESRDVTATLEFMVTSLGERCRQGNEVYFFTYF